MNNRSILILFSMIVSLFSGMQAAAMAGAGAPINHYVDGPILALDNVATKIKFAEDERGNVVLSAQQADGTFYLYNVTNYPRRFAHWQSIFHTPLRTKKLKWIKGTHILGFANAGISVSQCIINPKALAAPLGQKSFTPYAQALKSYISPDLTHFAIMQTEQVIQRGKIDGSEPIKVTTLTNVSEHAVDVAFNSSNTLLLILTNKRLILIDTATGDSHCVTDHYSPNPWARFNKAGTRVLYSVDPHQVGVLSTHDGSIRGFAQPADKIIVGGRFIFNGNGVLIRFTGENFRVVTLDGTDSLDINGVDETLRCIVSQKHHLVAFLTSAKKVLILREHSAAQVINLRHEGSITNICINEEDGLLISAADDKSIMAWDIASGNHVKTIHTQKRIPLKIASYKEWLVYQTAEKELHILKF